MSELPSTSIFAIQHQYAAWCAARAVAVPCDSIRNEAVLFAINSAKLDKYIYGPELLPGINDVDTWHLRMRQLILHALSDQGYSKSHGIAAKIINIYFKTIYCNPASCNHPNVAAMHPPIDSEIVRGIVSFGSGNDMLWQGVRWTELTSDKYEALISDIRLRASGLPLWYAEQFWHGQAEQ